MLNYKVVESFSSAKGRPEDNEDRVLILPHVVAVVDGATSSRAVGGIAGGIVAADAAAEALSSLGPSWTFPELVDRATALLAARLAEYTIGPSAARPSASLVAWNPGRDELYRLGDSHARLDGLVLIGDKEIDRIGNAFRNACLQGRMRLLLTTAAEAREVSVLNDVQRPLIDVQHAFQNEDTGHALEYGVIDGRPVPARFLEVHSTADVHELVLCSDGFPYPPATLAEGLEQLDGLRTSDPLLTHKVSGSRAFPSGRLFFDDTTYVRLIVER